MYNHVVAGKPLFNGEKAADHKKTVDEFKDLYIAVNNNVKVLAGIAKLSARFMVCTSVLAGETSYTSGLVFAIFEKLWDTTIEICELQGAAPKTAADPARLPSAQGQCMVPIALAFQDSLLERLATHYYASKYLAARNELGVNKRPSFLGYPNDKLVPILNRNARMFAAMLLDPAAFPLAFNRTPKDWKQHFSAYLYQEILVPSLRHVGEVQDAAPAPNSAAELKVKIKDILERPIPAPTMDTDMWASILQEEVERLKAQYAARGVRGEVEEGGGGAADPFLPVKLALDAEIEVHASVLMVHFQKGNEARNAIPKREYEPFGAEISEGTKERYEYWPAAKGKMPLLFFCACMLLASDVNATTFSERMHSPLARITEKFRASMRPDKAKRLTLAYFLVRDWLKRRSETEIQMMLDVHDADDNNEMPGLVEDEDEGQESA